MYSRYHNSTGRPLRLPENYSGCAFSAQPEPQPTPAPAPPPQKQESPIRTPHAPPPPAPLPPSLPPPEHRDPPPAPDKKPAPSDAARGLLAALPHAFPFAHGLGSEELLLIGLIILLSRCEQDSDMVLWLTLLLFCG